MPLKLLKVNLSGTAYLSHSPILPMGWVNISDDDVFVDITFSTLPITKSGCLKYHFWQLILAFGKELTNQMTYKQPSSLQIVCSKYLTFLITYSMSIYC